MHSVPQPGLTVLAVAGQRERGVRRRRLRYVWPTVCAHYWWPFQVAALGRVNLHRQRLQRKRSHDSDMNRRLRGSNTQVPQGHLLSRLDERISDLNWDLPKRTELSHENLALADRTSR